MSTNNIRYNYVYLITNKINNKNYIGQHHGFLNDSYMGSGIRNAEGIPFWRR